MSEPRISKMVLTDMWDGKTCKIVGQIAIAFAQLEHVLWLSPKRIRNQNYSVWEAIAGIEPVPTRCQQIRDAYAIMQMDQEKEASLESLLRAVVDLNEKRNGILHARWGAKKYKGVVKSWHRIWKNHDRGRAGL